MKTTLDNTYKDILLETVTTSDNIYQRLDAAGILIAMLMSEIKELKQSQTPEKMWKEYDMEYFK